MFANILRRVRMTANQLITLCSLQVTKAMIRKNVQDLWNDMQANNRKKKQNIINHLNMCFKFDMEKLPQTAQFINF